MKKNLIFYVVIKKCFVTQNYNIVVNSKELIALLT